ncbi:hypothetical protein CYMTET_34349 [Cymbomonas tetramitiformis]|uniref:Uncharacterized protein n=1 Tax=Cymbomonas tetramitiformis TaxID=36881 RepID=A0AAE0KQ98_9CHLO|nr:hypothetical protein CYMTET_34349 [Cymbomonas tetramitiformis]
MRREVNTWLRPFLEPLFSVVPDKAHAFLALAVDPRFKGLGVIVGLIGAEAALRLRDQYDEEHLIPMILANHAIRNAIATGPAEAPPSSTHVMSGSEPELGCNDLQEREALPEITLLTNAIRAQLKQFRGFAVASDRLMSRMFGLLRGKFFSYIPPPRGRTGWGAQLVRTGKSVCVVAWYVGERGSKG